MKKVKPLLIKERKEILDSLRKCEENQRGLQKAHEKLYVQEEKLIKRGNKLAKKIIMDMQRGGESIYTPIVYDNNEFAFYVSGPDTDEKYKFNIKAVKTM